MTTHMAITGAEPDAKITPLIDLKNLPPLSDKLDLESILGADSALNEALPNLARGEPTAILIDGNNLSSTARKYGMRIDYAKIYEIFASRCDLRYCGFFTSVDPDLPKQAAWIHALKRAGLNCITKNIRRYENETGMVVKGNMDVEITLAATELSEGFSHVILGSCDGDFGALIGEDGYLRKGKLRKVSVMGIHRQGYPGMSRALMREADNFYNLLSIRDHIAMGEKF